MRHGAYIFLMVLFIAGLISVPVVPGLAASSTKKELMVTSFETGNTVYAGQKAAYTVQVVSDDPNDPKTSMMPYDGANVTVYFKNANTKLINSKPVSEKGGIYKGAVVLPGTGQWDVLVLALRKGEKEAADSSNVYTMSTQLAVHAPVRHTSAWIYNLGFVILGIFLIFVIWLIRRKNREKNKLNFIKKL